MDGRFSDFVPMPKILMIHGGQMRVNRICGFLFLLTCCMTGSAIGSESVTGGIIGGLLPSPKFLKGSVDGEVYTTPDKSFRVALPYGGDAYEWNYAVVREGQDAENVTWVIFGPGAFNRNFYHAVLIKRAIADTFDEQVNAVYASRTKGLASVGGPFRRLEEKKADANGRKSVYGVFENDAQFLVLTVIDMGVGVASLQLQVPKDAIRDVDRTRAQLISRDYGSFNTFFDSFSSLTSK